MPSWLDIVTSLESTWKAIKGDLVPFAVLFFVAIAVGWFSCQFYYGHKKASLDDLENNLSVKKSVLDAQDVDIKKRLSNVEQREAECAKKEDELLRLRSEVTSPGYAAWKALEQRRGADMDYSQMFQESK